MFGRFVRQGRLRQLQLLLALQECGSIVQAAARMDMSQSAATQALAELERMLDLPLFERHARGIRATLAGQALVDAVGGVMRELEDATETLAAIRLGALAALRLGAIPAAAYSILSLLLPQFYVRHPQVHLDVHEGPGRNLLPQLINGGLDALFCREPAVMPPSFLFEPLLPDEAVVIAARKHPLAQARQIPLSALRDARWVLPTAHIAVREIFERDVLALLPNAQWFPFSTESLPVLQALLSQPKAVALLPRSIMSGIGAAADLCFLDIQMSRSALAPLGVAYQRNQAPRLLEEMLRLWREEVPTRGIEPATPPPPPPP